MSTKFGYFRINETRYRNSSKAEAVNYLTAQDRLMQIIKQGGQLRIPAQPILEELKALPVNK